VTISTAPLSAITLCHIHYATTAGTPPGSPIYNMTTSNAGGCNAQTTFTLNTWNTGYNGYAVSSGGDLAGFGGGYYYVNIHTITNPGGEIYGFEVAQPGTPSPSASPSSATAVRSVTVFLLFVLTVLYLF